MLNVDNGPGSNGLRGGIKQYSAKTTTGQWLDTYGGPMGYKRGFTTSDFQTEAQHAQLGVTKKPSGQFGAGIPIIESRDARGNDLGSVGTENWISNTKATHPNFGVVRKVRLSFLLVNARNLCLFCLFARVIYSGGHHLQAVKSTLEQREASGVSPTVDL